jgi:hypothetical protein
MGKDFRYVLIRRATQRGVAMISCMKKPNTKQRAARIDEEPLAVAATKINIKTRRRVSRLREEIQRLNEALDDGTSSPDDTAK